MAVVIKAIKTLAAVFALPAFVLFKIWTNGWTKVFAEFIFSVIFFLLIIIFDFNVSDTSLTVSTKAICGTEDITVLAIVIKAIDTFGFIGALPAGALVEIRDGIKVFTLYFSAIAILFFIIFTTLLTINVETSRCTESVAGFTIVIKTIDTLATILAFPAVALVRV